MGGTLDICWFDKNKLINQIIRSPTYLKRTSSINQVDHDDPNNNDEPSIKYDCESIRNVADKGIFNYY